MADQAAYHRRKRKPLTCFIITQIIIIIEEQNNINDNSYSSRLQAGDSGGGDPWANLKAFTAARIALGRTGISEPLNAMLQFRLAHAHARDAVYATMNTEKLMLDIQALQSNFFLLSTQAYSRNEYLQNPDFGRRLDEKAAAQLTAFNSPGYDICMVMADGLSALAINNHAIPVLTLLQPKLQQRGFSVAPVCIIGQARVAIGDEAGWLLRSKMVIVFIGERPGLSSPDSLGVYLTYQPKPGLTDESRNCISNIRPEGLNYSAAAEKIDYLASESLRLKLSGISLKDDDVSTFIP